MNMTAEEKRELSRLDALIPNFRRLADEFDSFLDFMRNTASAISTDPELSAEYQDLLSRASVIQSVLATARQTVAEVDSALDNFGQTWRNWSGLGAVPAVPLLAVIVGAVSAVLFAITEMTEFMREAREVRSRANEFIRLREAGASSEQAARVVQEEMGQFEGIATAARYGAIAAGIYFVSKFAGLIK